MKLTLLTPLSRRLPSPLYKLAAQSFIDYKFPRHIFIETTANCNLSCEYCPREKIREDMRYEMFKEIINEATSYGPRSFSLHLFGEPLLYPRILEAIDYIKTANKRHTVLLTTNGTILNKFARELSRLKVDRVIWSYRKNNFSEESIKLLRNRGLIRLLIEETPKEEFERWSKFPRVEVKHLHNYGGNIDTSKWGIHSSNLDRWPCYHLWLAPAIRWNGEITFCCNVPKRGTEVLGIYGETTLGNVWRGEKLKSIRDSHMKGVYTGACAGCNSYQAYPDIFFSSQKKEGHHGL